MKEEEKFIELINKLKARKNNSYQFFEGLLSQLRAPGDSSEAMNKLLSCFSITQYSDFTKDEEMLLSDVIEGNMNSADE